MKADSANSTLSESGQLKNLWLRSKEIAEGFMLGLHKSPYHGFSAEFSQHRPYQFGDEIRHIDWTLYGKTDRYYIRQFQEETNLNAMICVDNSASMAYGSSTLRKFDYAALLSASLAFILLRQNDATGLCLFNDRIEELIRPKAVMSYHRHLSERLQNAEVRNGTEISQALHHIAEKMKKRGLIILISDLWDDSDSIIKGLRHLKFRKQELIVFHILDPAEVDFDYRRKISFTGMEEDTLLKIDTRQIEHDYRQLMLQRIQKLRHELGMLHIDYLMLRSDSNPDVALREYLIKRKHLH